MNRPRVSQDRACWFLRIMPETGDRLHLPGAHQEQSRWRDDSALVPTRDMISGHDGSGQSTARPKQIRRVLEEHGGTRQTSETPVSRWQVEHVKVNGIRSAQPSGHSTSQCVLVTPGGPSPRCSTQARSRCSSQVWASVCPGSGVAVPKPQNAQAAVTDQGWRVRTARPSHPSTSQALAPGSNSCFGQVVRVAGRAPANRQRGKCTSMCHPFELARGAMRLAPQKRAQRISAAGVLSTLCTRSSVLQFCCSLSRGRIEQHWLRPPGGLDSA